MTSPDIQLLSFTKQEVVDKLARTPISTLIWNLVGVPHHGRTSLSELQHKLQEAAGFNEERLGEIFDLNKGPCTADEEELFHLVNLRGSMGVLVTTCLSQPHLPADIKRKFTENVITNATDEYDYRLGRLAIVNEIFEWGQYHPEQDLPLIPDNTTWLRFGNLYDRTQNLTRFYNEKRPLITLQQYSGHKGTIEDNLRSQVVCALRFMLDPGTPIVKLNYGI